MENTKVVDLSHGKTVGLLGQFASSYLSFDESYIILEVFGYGSVSSVGILTKDLEEKVTSHSKSKSHQVTSEHFGKNYYRIIIHLDCDTMVYEALYLAQLLSGYGFRSWSNIR